MGGGQDGIGLRVEKLLSAEKKPTFFRQCPDFGQDRVNFLQKVGGGMARTLMLFAI